MKKYIVLFLFGYIGMSAEPAVGGECLGAQEEYLNEIKQRITSVSEKDKEIIRYNLSCLRGEVGYLAMGYEYFASPTAIARIRKANKKTKSLAYEILPGLLRHKDRDIRCSAARSLAFYAWSESFDSMTECDENYAPRTKAILFAILGDKRAVPWIIRQYKIVEKKYRTKPIFSYPDKMTYLNALYHLADPVSLPFIESVIKNPKPEKIRMRAVKVRQRIQKLGEK